MFFCQSLSFGAAKIGTIIIDPGHGGNAPGAVGAFAKEKDITLAVSLKLGKKIKEFFPEVKVLYTRDTDKSVDLWKRTKFANQNKGDLFISIHCNSSEIKKNQPRPKGFETWTIGVHKNEESLKVAQKENAAIYSENSYLENYENFDPNSPDAYIMFTMFQNAYSDQSLTLAGKIQEQYRSNIKSIDRGVKQAGFLVLYGCVMPAVLTEIGFINNPEEEQFMASEEGQDKIATSLFDAFKEYKYKVEGFNNQGKAGDIPSAAIAETVLSKEISSKEEISKKEGVKGEQEEENSMIFKVQFASSSIDKPCNSPEFKGLKEVSKYKQDGIFKYCSGKEYSFESVQVLLDEVQKAGFRDAFVVVFKSGKRISTAEAMRILKENK